MKKLQCEFCGRYFFKMESESYKDVMEKHYMLHLKKHWHVVLETRNKFSDFAKYRKA